MEHITSRKNPLVQHLKKLGSDKAYREQCGLFLCDGIKLYEEAVGKGVDIPLLATSDPSKGEYQAEKAIYLPQDVLESISPQKSPQGLLFACKMQKQNLKEGAKVVFVLEGIQDPGNLGTLIRTANAFSVDQIIVTGNTADIYHPKTIRSTMGAIFEQKITSMSVDEIRNYVNRKGLVLLGAALNDKGQKAGGKLEAPIAIAIGSEGKGLSQALLDICHDTIQIPMEAQAESLNAAVAGSILMWEIYRGKG